MPESKHNLFNFVLLGLVAISLVISSVVGLSAIKEERGIGSIFVERTPYDAIGTASSPATLTTDYAGNSTTLFAENLENLHLDIAYTPLTTGAYALILVEGSNDGGTTYFPLTTKTVATSSISLYVNGVSSTLGIPLVFPGDLATVTSTELKGNYDTDIVANWIRISASEVDPLSTSTAGTLYVRATLTSKK